MSILYASLRQLLITPIAQSDADFLGIRTSVKFWLSLSLIFSVFYSILGLFIAFSSKYVIQDDAREYVFWMQRFIDPTILPHDLIAEYFTSITPLGYQARMMPELAVGGRHPSFDNNAWRFWLGGEHSRILPLLLPPIWAGLWLPTMLCHPDRFPLIRRIRPTFAILPEIIWISFSLYAAAHVLWLKLFFPSRYTEHTFRILMALASGIVLTTLLDKVLRNCEQTVSPDVRPGEQHKKNRRLILTVALALMLILYPQLFNTFPKKGYKISSESALYTFLQEQPKDIMIASLSEEASSISTFAQRSVLFSREHALPFHPVYYRQIRQRCIDLIQAQYSQDLTVVQQVIEKYGISFLLLDQTAFTPQYLVNNTNRWLSSFQPVFGDALTALEQEKAPAVATLSDRCSVVKGKKTVLLHADCLMHPSQWQNGERVSKLLQSS